MTGHTKDDHSNIIKVVNIVNNAKIDAILVFCLIFQFSHYPVKRE